jgi:hypothetical protein
MRVTARQIQESRSDHHLGIPGLSLVGFAAKDIPE